MSLVSIYKRTDGGVSISPIVRDRFENETDQEFNDSVFKRVEAVFPDGERVGVFDSSIVDSMYATNDDFRNAWTWNDGLVVRFSEAQELTKEKLRTERTPLLANLDTAYLRALEQGSDTNSIIIEKQRLRDITSLVDSATTLEELRSITV